MQKYSGHLLLISLSVCVGSVWILEGNEVSQTSCRVSLNRVVIVLSGECPFFWAVGSLFICVWTEPKNIVDTCSMVLVGCLGFGVSFHGEEEYEI